MTTDSDTPKKTTKKAGEPKPKRAAKATSATRKAAEATAKKFAVEAARLANDLHCDEILLLDVREKSDMTDFILIASGTSDRQIRAVGQNIVKLGQEMDTPRFGQDIDEATLWIVLDFVDVVVHLFDPATRGHYDLEMLWGDAPKVTWRRKAGAKSEE
jgi:ribosome-associated protein